jgi:hypothetical protein
MLKYYLPSHCASACPLIGYNAEFHKNYNLNNTIKSTVFLYFRV